MDFRAIELHQQIATLDHRPKLSCSKSITKDHEFRSPEILGNDKEPLGALAVTLSFKALSLRLKLKVDLSSLF